jgi:rhodanese-related sulfurtransferase
MRQMRVAELKAQLDQGDSTALLLDVREPWEFRICHIEGARLIPMRQVPTAHPFLDPSQETVVICHHGIRSRQVALFLERQGFTNIVNLEGGMAAWARDVDPTIAVY